MTSITFPPLNFRGLVATSHSPSASVKRSPTRSWLGGIEALDSGRRRDGISRSSRALPIGQSIRHPPDNSADHNQGRDDDRQAQNFEHPGLLHNGEAGRREHSFCPAFFVNRYGARGGQLRVAPPRCRTSELGAWSGDGRGAAGSTSGPLSWPRLPECRHGAADHEGQWARRPAYAGLGRAEIATDENDDLVKISIIVKAGNPRLVWRGRVGSRCEHEERNGHTERSESVQNDPPSHRCIPRGARKG